MLTDLRLSGLNVVALVLVFLFVYETKEASLEELNSICKLGLLFLLSENLPACSSTT